jgi:cutinase
LAQLAFSAVATVLLIATSVLPAERASVGATRADAWPAVQVAFARGTSEASGLGRVGEAFVEGDGVRNRLSP